MTTEPLKLTDDLLVRIEHAITFYDRCCSVEHISVEERALVRKLRDRARALANCAMHCKYDDERLVYLPLLDALREVL